MPKVSNSNHKESVMYKSNIVYGLLLSMCVVSAGMSTVAQDEKDKLAQGLVFGVGDRVLWKTVHQKDQRDVLNQPLTETDSLTYDNQTLSLFLTRAAELRYSVGDFVDLDELEDIAEQGLRVKFRQDVGAEPDPADYEGEEENLDYIDDLATWNAAIAAGNTKATSVAARLKSFVERITFQEHKVGVVLEKEWRFGQYYVSARTWLGLAERNYWLDSDTRKGITGAMQDLFPSNDGTFNLSDYVTTNWGFGDVHLKGGVVSEFKNNLMLRTGAKLTLPTAPIRARRTAHQLIPLRLDQLQGYGRTRLNEVLIAPQLGNGGHYGVGAWTDAVWAQKFVGDKHELKLKAYASLDYLLEAAEERLLMQYVDKSLDIDAAEFAGGTVDQQFRAYIGQHVLPEPVELIIAPGVIGRVGATAQYTFEKARFFIGYDWYYKSKEQVVKFVNPEDAPLFSPIQEQKPVSSGQHTIHGGIAHNTMHTNVPFLWYTVPQIGVSVSMHGAVALSSVGMGNEFGLGVSLGLKY
jgi:hypothetical protein